MEAETLRNLLEEFVTREGTDSGYIKGSLETEIARVMRQLTLGRAFLVYDEATESCNIVPAEFIKRQESEDRSQETE